MVFVIIALLLAFSIRGMKIASIKAYRLNAFSDFTAGRVALMESFALSGAWPERQSLSFERYETPTLNIDTIQGVINLELHNRREDRAPGKVLSMRPATGALNATVVWVCGNAAVPDGMQVSGVNATTLSRDELYIVCR